MNGSGVARKSNPASRHVPPTGPRRSYICLPNLSLATEGGRGSVTYNGKPAANADRKKLFDASAEAATGRYALLISLFSLSRGR
jgi:hypothetical protein